MSTHSICFHRELRKISILLKLKKKQQQKTSCQELCSLYIIVWIQHSCLANMVLALDPSNNVIKRLWSTWKIALRYGFVFQEWKYPPHARPQDK